MCIIRIIHVRERVVFQFIFLRGIIWVFVTIGCKTLLPRIHRYAQYLCIGDRVPILHKKYLLLRVKTSVVLVTYNVRWHIIIYSRSR